MSKKQEYWKAQVEGWRASGLSMAEWCRRHHANYQQFLYWRDRFSLSSAGFFKELEDEALSASTGIEISCGQLTVCLQRGFDSEELARCLRAIVAFSC